MQTISTEAFKNILLFRLKMTSWANKRQGDMNQVQTDADKSRLTLGKKLIVCPEYDAVKLHLQNLRTWCLERSMPSMLDDGLFAVRPSMVEQFEEHLKQAQVELREKVQTFIAAYPDCVNEARVRLNGLFNSDDYPNETELADKFSIAWRWVAFEVPEGLSPEIRAQEIAKMQTEMREASEEIVAALRQSFSDLISHTVEKLTTEPGSKPKVFRDTFVPNIATWLETFDSRNLMNDSELANLVARAKEILGNTDNETLRTNESVRNSIAQGFATVKAEVDKMIIDKPARKFDFTE